jgi:sugar/nucleoside kinase (ribokinase family)
MTISLTYPEDRALITYMGSIPLLQLEDIDIAILRHYDHLHISSYFLLQRLKPGLPELFHQAHQAGLTVSLDTGYDPEETWGGDALLALLESVDAFLPNEEEACAIAGVDDTEAALCTLAARAKLVVAKCGADGAMYLRDGEVVRAPGFRVDVVDTTGAGDSFNAGFIHARVVQGLPLAEAVRFANACGALSATGVGGTAAQPTLEQASSFLKVQAQP